MNMHKNVKRVGLVGCFVCVLCLSRHISAQQILEIGEFFGKPDPGLVFLNPNPTVGFSGAGIGTRYTASASSMFFRAGFGRNGAEQLFLHSKAPHRAVRIDRKGVGIGISLHPDTNQALDPLHVFGSDLGSPFANARITIENIHSRNRQRQMIFMKNNGGSFLTFFNDSSDEAWSLGTSNQDHFGICRDNALAEDLIIFKNGRVVIGNSHVFLGPNGAFHLRPNGNLQIGGVLTESSDVNLKENFDLVDSQELLSRLKQVPISTWSYKHDKHSVRHIGPTAQDFHRAFRLGEDDKTIASMDRSGVALAAIKGLSEKIEELESSNAELQKLLDEKNQFVKELDKRLVRLESIIRAEHSVAGR